MYKNCKIYLIFSTLITIILNFGSINLFANDTQIEISQQGFDIIKPYNVYVKVQLFRAHLDQIRKRLGQKKVELPRITISNAEPREVYFQALTLFRKVNILKFDFLRVCTADPAFPKGPILPFHVFSLVDAAHNSIKSLSETFELKLMDSKMAVNTNKKSEDVFEAIFKTNRQINSLLKRKFSPSDVYQQVEFAISYAVKLMNKLSLEVPKTIFTINKNKGPRDVHKKLLLVLAHMQKFANVNNVKVLKLKYSYDPNQVILPTDVYDISSLIISELNYFHEHFEVKEKIKQPTYPLRKFPYEVYQKAELLELMLSKLSLTKIKL